MARRGRKRKEGRRVPSGDLARTPKVSGLALAARQPHRRDLPPGRQLDRLAATELGRLLLTGTLSELQHEAGERYLTIVGRYRAVIESPRAVSGSGRAYHCDGCGEGGCECERRKRAYEQARLALVDHGQRVLMTVNGVVLDEAPCLRQWVPHLRIGLDALVAQLGLTTRRQIAQSGN